MSIPPRVVRIRRIGLTVADLAPARAFYEQILGFRMVAAEVRGRAAFAALTGLAGARADVAVLRLGAQEIELAAFTPAGRPYPADRAANDPWFQHFAIVTADMAAAYAALGERPDAAPISEGGPQLLPPATGSVTAYKFRDPEGHPLELSLFPPVAAAAAWRDPPAGAVFLGVDHSAIAVADAEASTAFYVRLGLRVAARQVNAGPTQARLDGLAGAEVDIVSLDCAEGGPHLELLAYRRPAGRGVMDDLQANDIAATRLILDVEGLPELVERLGADPGRFVSDGIVTLEDGARAALIRDPDGHLLELHDRPQARDGAG